MEILESREKVCRFYRERTGINILAYDRTVTELFEGLYYHRSPITFRQLLIKMEQSGLKFSCSGLDKARFEALCKKVKPEPCPFTKKGAVFWYMSQLGEFTAAELEFMQNYSPVEFHSRYPNIQHYMKLRILSEQEKRQEFYGKGKEHEAE